MRADDPLPTNHQSSMMSFAAELPGSVAVTDVPLAVMTWVAVRGLGAAIDVHLHVDAIDRRAMHDLVQPMMVHLVEPAGLKVMLLAIVRPAHRDERMRHKRHVEAAAPVASAAHAIDVRRYALEGRELAQPETVDAAEVERRDEISEPGRLR